MTERVMRNLLCLLPDGCIPVEIWAPHGCEGWYVIEAYCYGPAGRIGRWMGEDAA